MKQSEFYNRLFQLSTPLTLQFLFTSSFMLIDSLMVASLGEKAIATVGIAGQFEFFLSMILAGVLSGPALFISQYYGKRDYESIRKLSALTVYCALPISLLFFIILTACSPYVIMPFTSDQQLLHMTDSYVAIIEYSYMVSAVTLAFAMNLKSIGDVKTIMILTILSLVLNSGLNYVLIYGHFGFTAMGVNGTAVATLISKIVLLVGTLVYVYTKKPEVAVSFFKKIPMERALIRKVFHITRPIIIHETFWGLGTILYLVAFGMKGAAAIAIIQVSRVIFNFVLAGLQGFSQAASVMIGEQIGMNNGAQAQHYAERLTKIGVIIALCIGCLQFVMAPQLADLFHFSDSSHATAVHIIRIMAVSLLLICLNNVWIVGVFRSGGDTRYSMMLVLVSIWLVGLPLAFLGAGVLKWPIEAVYTLQVAEELSKATFGYFRFRSRRWQHNLVNTG